METDMTKSTSEKATVTKPSDREVRIERILDAPRDRVWRAFTEEELIAQWWARGNKLVIEKFEPRRGGHWRFVEHTDHGVFGFEGRYREVTPQERIVRSFEWDGMPAHVLIEQTDFIDLGDGRTKLVTVSIFHTQAERDGMVDHGMVSGIHASFAALDALLAKMG